MARVSSRLMSVPTVADNVEHDVLAEGLPILDGERARADHRLDVVAVDVEDGGAHRLGHVGAVHGRP